MQEFPETTLPQDQLATQPEPDSIQRLLVALGEWGAAEVRGASGPLLERLEDEAQDAFDSVAAAA